MSRARIQFRCRQCGGVTPRWAGRCGRCGEWASLDEETLPPGGRPEAGAGSGAGGGAGASSSAPVPLGSLDGAARSAVPTGLDELDRVLGGGLVPSSVTLLAGEPGIGKSTLLLQALAALARGGTRALLVSAEESPAQVRLRADRLGVSHDGVWVAGDTDLAALMAAIDTAAADVVVVDSIQTVGDRATGLAPGTPAAVRHAAGVLAERAKTGGPALILVGHVTKEGSIAGPKLLEHLVDTVLSFEGERHHALRTLRAVKHRFGPVGELGLWEMTGGGLIGVPDGTSFLLADRRPGVPGSCVHAGLEGRRPVLAEVQALVIPEGIGRRSATRVESARLSQLIAVLDQRAGVHLRQHDVYVSAVGGLRLAEPGADLALAVAVTSAFTGRCVDADVAVVGEVGLGGELRQVSQSGRRLVEAARAGFRRALVPVGTPAVEGIELWPASDLAGALEGVLRDAPLVTPKLRVVGGSGQFRPA